MNTSIFKYILILIPFGLLAALYYPTLFSIGEICWNSDDYSHGVLLPFIAVYLIWDRRAQILNSIQHIRKKDFTFLLPALSLTLGMFVFYAGEASGSLFARWVSFFPSAIGIIFLVFGITIAKQVIGPVLLMFLAKPLPDSLVIKLFHPFQVLAARVSAWILDVLSVPVYLQGNIIEIPGMRLMVEEACSGMRSLMAILTVAFVVISFLEVPKKFQPLFIVIAVTVAIILNVFRVATTGVLAHFYDPDAASGFFHTFSGMVVFVLGLIILFYVAKLLIKISEKS